VTWHRTRTGGSGPSAAEHDARCPEADGYGTHTRLPSKITQTSDGDGDGDGAVGDGVGEGAGDELAVEVAARLGLPVLAA